MPVFLKWQFSPKTDCNTFEDCIQDCFIGYALLIFVACFLAAPVYMVQVVSTE